MLFKIFRSLRRRWKHWKKTNSEYVAATLPPKQSIEIWSFGFWGEGESGVLGKKKLKKQEPTTSHHIRHRLLLRLQEVYNANIQSRLPVITYSRINIYTEGLFTWSGGPRSSGVGFFCFHALGDTKQKKPTPLDRGPPLHVNRVWEKRRRLLKRTWQKKKKTRKCELCVRFKATCKQTLQLPTLLGQKCWKLLRLC